METEKAPKIASIIGDPSARHLNIGIIYSEVNQEQQKIGRWHIKIYNLKLRPPFISHVLLLKLFAL